MIESPGQHRSGGGTDIRGGSQWHGRRARLAVAHDWLCGYRGGEAVLERIAGIVEREFEPAGLWVMFDDGWSLSPTVDAWRARGLVAGTGIGRSRAGLRARRWLLPLYPRLVRSLSSDLAKAHAERPIDLLISTSSAAMKGMAAPPGVPHLCYCHSPARYVWSQRAESAGKGLGGALRRAGLAMYGARFREWDRRTAGNVHRFLANSTHTAGQIGNCYRRESVVVPPPVRTGYFTPDASVAREKFWLVVSALEPYKRVDLAMGAARRAGVELVVAGDGSQRRVLERGGGAGVRFVGRVSDDELRRLYRSAALLVFPQVEDFGIVAAEAQACGLPVVARRMGGAMDIVVDGVTGILFDQGTPEAIVRAAAGVPRGCAGACRENAERFGEAVFDRAMLGHIRGMVAVPSSPA